MGVGGGGRGKPHGAGGRLPLVQHLPQSLVNAQVLGYASQP